MRIGLRNQILVFIDGIGFCFDAKIGIITTGSARTWCQYYRSLDEVIKEQRLCALIIINKIRDKISGVVVGRIVGRTIRRIIFWRDISVAITTIDKIHMIPIRKRPIYKSLIWQGWCARSLRRTNNGRDISARIIIGRRIGGKTRAIKFWRSMAITISIICKIPMIPLKNRPIYYILIAIVNGGTIEPRCSPILWNPIFQGIPTLLVFIFILILRLITTTTHFLPYQIVIYQGKKFMGHGAHSLQGFTSDTFGWWPFWLNGKFGHNQWGDRNFELGGSNFVWALFFLH